MLALTLSLARKNAVPTHANATNPSMPPGRASPGRREDWDRISVVEGDGANGAQPGRICDSRRGLPHRSIFSRHVESTAQRSDCACGFSGREPGFPSPHTWRPCGRRRSGSGIIRTASRCWRPHQVDWDLDSFDLAALSLRSARVFGSLDGHWGCKSSCARRKQDEGAVPRQHLDRAREANAFRVGEGRRGCYSNHRKRSLRHNFGPTQAMNLPVTHTIEVCLQMADSVEELEQLIEGIEPSGRRRSQCPA